MFASLSFATSWILAGLVVLPLIWWLLRVTPPAPRRVAFPPLRLLHGLRATEQTPAHTPWWLLLLRIIVAALIIVALAGPILGGGASPGSGPLVLFVDNGWTSAHAWADRQTAITDALTNASGPGRPVAIVPTAADRAPAVTLMDSGKAMRSARGLVPEPWLPDRKKAAAVLAASHFSTPPDIVWLSDGLDYGDASATARALSRIGHLNVMGDTVGRLPLALRPERNEVDGFATSIARAGGMGGRRGNVLALGSRGEILATAPFRFAAGHDTASAKLRLPLELRNQTQRLAIANEDSAGAVRLLDASAKRRAVGLVSASNAQSEQPLLSDIYYLERALSPYADLHKGTIGDALDRNVSVIVLADVGRIAGSDRDRMVKFLSDGGVLIRFAGGRMTEAVDDIIPVKLRTGGRYLGGALAWASPQRLASFPDASPFRGLAVPRDVTISRQVLAEPSVELGGHTWARLADGTPLVTAAPRGKGWLILFHVTAGPAWSSLPLSGLYVDMLRRLLLLGGGAHPGDVGFNSATVLPPLATLDGFGRLQKPPADVLPLRGAQIVSAKPSASHPPGFYGIQGSERALNAVDADMQLKPLGDIGAPIRAYSSAAAMDLQPWLLAIALLLLLADGIVSLWLRGYLANARRWLVPGTAVLLLLPGAPDFLSARASDLDREAALDTRLAYVITGVGDVDQMSKAGLTGLGLYLKARTSYDPKEPVGVDLDRDELAFFPLIYWPIDPRERDLSPRALVKLSDYMRNGGTILIDTRDQSSGAGGNGPGQQALRRLIGKLDVPPLQPVPPDHVLRKSFYLLQDFPGRWDGGKVWLEALPPPDPDARVSPARGGDNVSPVIIGGNDWAAAWAVDASGQPIADVAGGDQQRELAVRFGVNVVMYALTGNYKTDQVHAPALLERMGR
ncbi:MAG: DUF4159 domain-containing protein [Alphaproteobacteria bacterium]|nr:DUF4159 domain-containing protein [Alphaproteobacteria bacterium]